MKKSATRLFALVLALALCASLWGGALAEDAARPEFADHDEIDITWFEQGWTGPDEDLDIIAPAIEEVTNLKMNYEAMTTPTGDDYTQQLNLMVASNAVPDAFFGGIDTYTRQIYQKLGEAGRIWDLTGMVTEEEYPNLYALIFPELNLYLTDKGQNWFLPTQTGSGYENLNEPPHYIEISTSCLEELGLDFPTTADEFHTYVYRSVNELGKNGLLIGENLGGLEHLLFMFFPQVGSHDSNDLPFDVSDNYKVCNYMFSDCDEMMAAAKYIWTFAQEGLFDKEILTLKTSQYQEKGANGTYAAIASSWWDIDAFNDAIGHAEYIAAPVIYASDEVKASRELPWTDWVGCWSSLIISTKVDEKTVRHLLAAMDWMATTEGQLLLNAGIEGETFNWNEDGTFEYTDEFKAATNDLDWNEAAAYGIFYYAQLVQNAPAISQYQATPSALLREDNYASWMNRADERARYDADMVPTYDYYFLKGDKENELMPAIKDAQLEYWARILTASSEEEVEQIVHDWNKTCVDMGINEIIAEREERIQAIIDSLS